MTVRFLRVLSFMQGLNCSDNDSDYIIGVTRPFLELVLLW